MWSAALQVASSSGASSNSSSGDGGGLLENLLSPAVIVAIVGLIGLVATALIPLLVKNRNIIRQGIESDNPIAQSPKVPEMDLSYAYGELKAWADGRIAVQRPPAAALARIKMKGDTVILEHAQTISELRGFSHETMNTDEWAQSHQEAVAQLHECADRSGE
jgi:hypothetical protein